MPTMVVSLWVQCMYWSVQKHSVYITDRVLAQLVDGLKLLTSLAKNSFLDV